MADKAADEKDTDQKDQKHASDKHSLDQKKVAESFSHVDHSKSAALFARAKEHIPGGVNSPVRSCKAVGGEPVFIHHADGAYMYDEDENRYIDYVGSWGAMILGHRHPRVSQAIEDAVQCGTSYGAPCRAEVEMAELICQMVPSVEMVRMVNSGTEACMSAIRLARAFTKRNLIVKFDGCYHGHADAFLVKAGSGLATLGLNTAASSPGVPGEFTAMTMSLPYNNVDALREAFAKKGDEIAAIIVEPVVGNAGVIVPTEEFLKSMQGLCKDTGALLIFDEVMTGFRVSLGGAQEKFGVKPDLTCFGKVIGGGLPVGAYGGRKDIMEMIAPLGPVYQAGTLSGNPLAMAAGLAQLRFLRSGKPNKELALTTEALATGLKEVGAKLNVPLQVVSVPGMLSVFFTSEEVKDFDSALKCNTELFGKVWHGLIKRGIYWPPSQFEAAFISAVHSRHDVQETIAAFEDSISEAK
ncbi:MAG: glutamate-1-semialdehyde 2,1-aminomutase [Cyanobacteria bacterium SZAS LIN-2]|nr:glutamate-1-semialdehyde 2,1-aminomutase [Cyanobacteria bacterium SZAS LIN-2]MBS2009554.1 glutamate-1-semialdehyde 2,1-aminomutase [Cyanobacteria bacterium SZAS TMP-1]